MTQENSLNLSDMPTAPREAGEVPIRSAAPTAGVGTPTHGSLVVTRDHRYQIVRPLGKGASGAVLLANCLDWAEGQPEDLPPRCVAIKFLSLDGYTAFTARRELSTLRVLRSPRIPRVWDWNVEPGEGHAFFVMTYYPAGSLAPGPGRGLRPDQVGRLLLDLLAALNTAHGAGCLHLDIKPGNVLDDGAGGYVLTDFGLTQPILASSAKTLTLGRGTPGYRAPEQRDPGNVRFDVRTDLYGVGATVRAMATGFRLEEGVDTAATRKTLHELRPDLSVPICDVVEALLEDRAENRPGSAAEVLTHVKFLLGGSGTTRAGLGRLPFPTRPVAPDEWKELAKTLMDPLWTEVLGSPEGFPLLVRVEPGVEICHEGEEDYATFVLLEGEVEIFTRKGFNHRIGREGTFIGEVSALTGTRRMASVRTARSCCFGVFNPAELDSFLLRHPAAAHRLVKLLAERVVQGTGAAKG